MARMCGSFETELCEATLGTATPVVIDGATDATLACVRFPPTTPLLILFLFIHGPKLIRFIQNSYVLAHMEYILTELLKNSFRATVDHYHRRHDDHPNASPAHLHTHPHPHPQSQSQSQHPLPPVLITIAPLPRFPGLTKPATVSLRIRDQGRGVSPPNMTRIFSYAFTTNGRSACGSSRYGYGRRHNDDYGAENDQDTGAGGGSYAAQYIGGASAVGSDMGALGRVGLFGEITGKGCRRA
jgi:26S proteasome regulatory subunit T1